MQAGLESGQVLAKFQPNRMKDARDIASARDMKKVASDVKSTVLHSYSCDIPTLWEIATSRRYKPEMSVLHPK